MRFTSVYIHQGITVSLNEPLGLYIPFLKIVEYVLQVFI